MSLSLSLPVACELCPCVSEPSCILRMQTVCNNMYGKGGLDSAETPTEPSPTDTRPSGPLVDPRRRPLRTWRRLQPRTCKQATSQKARGAHTVAYHTHIFVGGPLQYVGIWAFRARECRYSHRIPGRAAHSRALARALTKAHLGQHARLHAGVK